MRELLDLALSLASDKWTVGFSYSSDTGNSTIIITGVDKCESCGHEKPITYIIVDNEVTPRVKEWVDKWAKVIEEDKNGRK